jgi:hypothetical protein
VKLDVDPPARARSRGGAPVAGGALVGMGVEAITTR